jgi:hypothetical protein
MSIVEERTVTTVGRTGPSRFTGIGFAVLWLAGMVLIGSGPMIYEGGTLPEYAEAYADGTRSNLTVGAALLLWPVAAALLLWSVVHLTTSLASARPGSRVPGRIARLAAGIIGASLVISAAAGGAAGHVASGTGDFPPMIESGYALDMLSSQIWAAGVSVGAALLVALIVAARGSGALPRWLLWTGAVIAVALPFAAAVFMLPALFFVVWVAVATAMVKPGPVASR